MSVATYWAIFPGPTAVDICLDIHLSLSKQIRPAFENFVQTIDSEEKVSTQTPSANHYHACLSQYHHI